MSLSTRQWRDLIAEEANRAGIDPMVVEAVVMVESDGNPDAKSDSGAIGLMQVIPRWHRDLIADVASGLGIVASVALYHPRANVRVGCRHLAWCIASCGSVDAGVACYHSGQCHPPDDFVDGQGTPTTYHLQKFRTALAEVRAAIGVPTTPEDSAMPKLVPHHFVGLEERVWLPEDIEVIIDIVPSHITNVRSNQTFTGQNRTLYHQTGNTNWGADAWGERNYLHGVPRDKYGNLRYVGYNAAVDDQRIIQLTPFDEVTWSAGRGWWNQVAWGIEQCIGGGLDLAKARRNAMALHAGLCVAKGWTPLDNMYPHWSVYGKICPVLIIRASEWPMVEKETTILYKQALAASRGEDTDDAAEDAVKGWPYPDPVPPSFWEELHTGNVPYVRDRDTFWFRTNNQYAVRTATPRQQFAIEDDRVVGPELQPGTVFRSFTIGESFSGNQPWVITPMMTRVAMDDLVYVPEDDDEDPADLVVDVLQDVLGNNGVIDNSQS